MGVRVSVESAVMGHLPLGAFGEGLAVDRVKRWGWGSHRGWAAESGCEDPAQNANKHA
jgi:hypothetical protein